ncbi:MAG: hydratase [Alphaproteobacteria bacterium]|nr:hydratase [Alphaproteobacteria bacterium]
MEDSSARASSELLLRSWRDGTVIDALPAHLRPATRADGYAIQAHLEGAGAGALRGWKIAATSIAGQRHIGVDGPLAGRLLASMVHGDGATLALGANRMRVAEPEFAFVMARDLEPRAEPWPVDEVMARVAALHLAIEVPDSRFADFATAGAAQLVADNACAHQFVLGPEAPPAWRGLDLAAHVVHGRVGERPPREGRGANVLGDPRIALAWIANELSRHGMVLAAGQFVTTGTCMQPLEIAAGDEVVADFGILGRVSLRFAAT